MTVPKRLFDHRDDFARPVWKEKYGSSSLHYLPDLSLLSYLHSHVDHELRDLLQPLLAVCETAMTRRLPLPVKVTPQSEEHRFGYRFLGTEDGNQHAEVTDGSGSTDGSDGSPKISRKGLTRQRRSQTTVTESIESSQVSDTQNKQYTFTPEILTFVTHQNPLLAAFIHLLNPPPSLSSLSLTSSAGATQQLKKSKSGTEEEGTTVGGGGTEGVSEGDEKEESVRRVFGGVRSRVRTQLSARRTTYDQHTPLSPSPSSSWSRELDDVLVQFVTFPPMQHYLRSRLAAFNPVLSWESPAAASESGRGSRDSTLPLPKESLRLLALVPARGHALGSACSYSLHRFIEIGRVRDAVAFLSSEPAACHQRRTRLLADLALSSAFVERYSEILSLGQSGETASDALSVSPSPSSSPLSLLAQLSDPDMAARLSLSSLHNWPVETCRDLLSFCSHHLTPSSPLLSAVQEKLERIEIYSKIMAKCKALLLTKSGRERRKDQRSWTRWTDLARDSESKPQFVLDLLLTEREYDLARQWAAVHSLPQRVTQVRSLSPLSLFPSLSPLSLTHMQVACSHTQISLPPSLTHMPVRSHTHTHLNSNSLSLSLSLS